MVPPLRWISNMTPGRCCTAFQLKSQAPAATCTQPSPFFPATSLEFKVAGNHGATLIEIEFARWRCSYDACFFRPV